MKKIITVGLFLIGLSVAMCQTVWATSSIKSQYTVSGSAGNYLLEFTFANDIPLEYNQHINKIALDLPFDANAKDGIPGGPYWVHAPSGYSENYSALGGSGTDYNNIWAAAGVYDFPTGKIFPIFDIPSGDSLKGIGVHITEIPAAVHYAAFAWDGVCAQCADPPAGPGYFGDDAFLKGHITGFEGSVQITPEPASMILFGIGGAAMAVFGRRKKA